MEDSFGFKILEAIPTHPAIEQLAFPARREMASPLAQKERPGEIFLVPAIHPTPNVRAS
jgi:hypothetical protein